MASCIKCCGEGSNRGDCLVLITGLSKLLIEEIEVSWQGEVLLLMRGRGEKRTFQSQSRWNIRNWLKYTQSAKFIMKLYQRIEHILLQLRPTFSGEATFEWFVLLFWVVVLSTQPPAVTSYLNALGLGEGYYRQALYWFHSNAFRVDRLCAPWGNWLSDHQFVERLQGQCLYVGDGIKVGKEGRRMPGVKGLHQESADVSKPEWIRGTISML